MWRDSIRYYKYLEGLQGGVSNPRVALAAMDEANLQGMLYYTQIFTMIGRMCTHPYVELSKVRAMYHQREMEEFHKDPEVIPTVDPRYWPKTLETVEEYIIVFRGVDRQPLSNGFRSDLIAPVATNYPTYEIM